MVLSRPLASALVVAVALVAGGCGSDDDESPPPYLDQAELSVRALDDAGEAVAEATRLLAREPNAGRLVAVASALGGAATLVEEAVAQTRTAIAADDEEAGREALETADRAASRAADAGRRANEALIDASERLDIPYGELVSPETDIALDEASEALNEAGTQVAGALAVAG